MKDNKIDKSEILQQKIAKSEKEKDFLVTEKRIKSQKPDHKKERKMEDPQVERGRTRKLQPPNNQLNI